MLNPSKIISSIKMDLGVIGIALPFDNIDEVIMEVIKIKTLPTFSTYSPFYVPLEIKTDELTLIDRKAGSSIYELPDEFGDREIMFVRDIEQRDHDTNYNTTNSSSSNYGYYMGDMCAYGYQDLMLAQAELNLVGAATKGPSFKFYPPNKIEIFNESAGISGRYKLEVALEHSENLSTVPKTSRESFLKLATLDVKKFMYDNLKHYDNLETAYAQINLKIDDWQSAEQDRAALLEKWDSVYHLDVNQYIII